LFDGATQIGFARVVTDHLTFSWLCDVYVDPAYRGRGLATWMIECVLAHPAVALTRAVLRTRDAHKLYEKFGFQREAFMRRLPTP
jgi:GNAT superfamily N-acetyltransferase